MVLAIGASDNTGGCITCHLLIVLSMKPASGPKMAQCRQDRHGDYSLGEEGGSQELAVV